MSGTQLMFTFRGQMDRRTTTLQLQQVWLSTRDSHLRLPSRKLSPRYFGPFTIQRQINKVTYQLNLPQHYCISPFFHVSLLKPIILSLHLPQILVLMTCLLLLLSQMKAISTESTPSWTTCDGVGEYCHRLSCIHSTRPVTSTHLITVTLILIACTSLLGPVCNVTSESFSLSL